MDPSSRTREIFRENCDLKERLDQEQNNYRRKLEQQQQSQQQQAKLVKRLQDKVLQYKSRSQELENKVRSMNDTYKRQQLQEVTENFNDKIESRFGFKQNTESLLIQLEEEESRNNELNNLNSLLREKLDQSSESNRQLTQTVEALSNDLKTIQNNCRNQENEFSFRERSMENQLIEEHNNRLALWRDISDLRKNFEASRMESTREISITKAEINKITKNITETFTAQNSKKRDQENNMKKEIEHLRATVNRQVLEIEERDDREEAYINCDNARKKEHAELERMINSLRVNVKSLESENQALNDKRNEEIKKVRQEADAFQSSLRRVAASAMGDIDSNNEFKNDFFIGDNFLSPKTCSDATLSAVVAALDKKQQQISDLRVKETVSNEKNQKLENKLNEAASAERSAQREISNLKTENETLRKDMEFVSQDKEKAKNLLEKKSVDYSQLEIIKKNLNERIDKLSSELDKMQTVNTELDRSRQLLQAERDEIEKEQERQLRENERCHQIIDRLENSQSCLKDELLNVKENLNKVQIEKDVGENQRRDQLQVYEKLENEHMDCLNELRKTKYDKSNMEDIIADQKSSLELMEIERLNLNKFINQLESEKCNLQNDKNVLENDKWNMRNELISNEQERGNLQRNCDAFKEEIQYYKFEKEKIENEFMAEIKENRELTDQLKILTKEKNSLTEDLAVARNDVSKQLENCGRLNKDKEQLNRNNSTLTEQLRSFEKECQNQKEYIAVVRAEKSSLESSLYDLQQQNSMLISKKDQLQIENQELLTRKEALNNELTKVIRENEFAEQSFRQEFDQYKQNSIENEKQLRHTLELRKKAHDDDTEYFTVEQERIKREFDLRYQELLQNRNDEIDQVISKHNSQIDLMKKEIANIQQDNENALTKMQTEKYEIISKLEEENALLLQRLKNLNEEYDQITEELNRLKCDYSNLQGWSEQTVKELEFSISKLRNDLNENYEENSRLVANLNKTEENFKNFQEQSRKEGVTLTSNIDLLSENNDRLKLEISELNEKNSNLNNEKRNLENDMAVLRRSLAEEISEKEIKIRANKELFDELKNIEIEKSGLNRNLTDSRTKIASLQSHVFNAEAEIEDMRTNLKKCEGQKTEIDLERQQLRKELSHVSYQIEQLKQEKENLNNVCTKYEEKDTVTQNELGISRQKVSELELNRDMLLKDLNSLQNKLREMEQIIKNKDYKCQMTINDLNSTEDRLNRDKERLQEVIESSRQEINDLRMEVSCRDGRLNVLEDQISKTEIESNKVSKKLDLVCTAIRRSIGVEPSNTEIRTRSISPRRPSKERNSSVDKLSEVDVNLFRTAVITASERLARAEKDRDEYQAQLTFVSSDLADLNKNCYSLEERLQRVQKYSTKLEKEKSDLEIRLSNMQSSVSVQEENIKKLEKERKGNFDKINTLENQNIQTESEKRNINEQLNRTRTREEKLEAESCDLKQNLSNITSKLCLSEETRKKLEASLKQCRNSLQAKSEQINEAQKRNANQQKKIEELETKSSTLNCTSEKQNGTIFKLEQELSSNQNKNSKLSLMLIESENKLEVSYEKINILRKDLSECDNKNKLLQQKIVSAESQLAKLKRENKELIDKADNSNFELKETKYAIGELELQIQQLTQSLSFQEQEKQKNIYQLRCAEEQRDRLESQIKEQIKLFSNLECDKNQSENSLILIKKENECLKRQVMASEKERSQMDDKLNSTVAAQNTYNRALQNLEVENSDLQKLVGELQVQLNEVEEAYSQRMFDISTKRHIECEKEVQKLLNAQNDAANMLKVRERVNKQRVQSLQQQVQELKRDLLDARKSRF